MGYVPNGKLSIFNFQFVYHHTATGLSHQGTGEKRGRKIAGAIFRNGRCDSAKWDMRFGEMGGAIFMSCELGVRS